MKLRQIIITAAAVGGLGLAVPAAAASARTSDGGPAPQGTPSPSYSLPVQGHDHEFRTEAGDILIASGGINVVNAFGPVRGVGGTDDHVSDSLDVWSFGHVDSVNVIHTAAPAPDIDLRTCSLIIDQRDGSWRFAGGTGEDRGARGYGKFTELALFSFPVDKRGHCSLADERGYMNNPETTDPTWHEGGREIRPLEFSIEVQFVGKAKVERHENPCPEITGPVYDYGTANPDMPVCDTGTPYGPPVGQPTVQPTPTGTATYPVS